MSGETLMPSRARRSKPAVSQVLDSQITNPERSSPVTPDRRNRYDDEKAKYDAVPSRFESRQRDVDFRPRQRESYGNGSSRNDNRSRGRPRYSDQGSGFNRGHQNSSYNDGRRDSPESPDEEHDVPEGALLIGDSMLKSCIYYMDTVPLKDFFAFSYPGIRAEGLVEALKSEYLPPPRRVGTILLHVGTNNASQSRVKSTVSECAQEIIECIYMVRKLYPASMIFVSSILPRLDEDHLRAVECNKIVAVYVNTEMTDDEMVKVIDFSTDFYFQNDGENALKEYMYRKSQIEQKSPVEGEEVYVDNVHLSDEGGQRFMELIHHSLEAAKFDNKKRKVLGSQLLKLKDWNTFRVQEFGMFGEHIRHRETNYMAAIKKDYALENSDERLREARRSEDWYERNEDDDEECQNEPEKEETNEEMNERMAEETEFQAPFDIDEESLASSEVSNFSANKEGMIDWENKDEFDYDYDDDLFADAEKQRANENIPEENDENDTTLVDEPNSSEGDKEPETAADEDKKPPTEAGTPPQSAEENLCSQANVQEESSAEEEKTPPDSLYVDIDNHIDQPFRNSPVIDTANLPLSDGMSDASDEFIIDEDLMDVPNLVKKARRKSNTKPVHFRAQPNSPPPVPKVQALVPSRKRKARN